MTGNLKVSIDKTGRLVVPKEIRSQLQNSDDTRLSIRQDKDYLYFDVIDNELTIDSFGRVLIPKKLRKDYSLVDIVLLSSTANGFRIKNNKSKYQGLINKIVFLEKNYYFKFILVSDYSLIYKSKDYNTLISDRIIEIHSFLSSNSEFYETFKIDLGNEVLNLFIVYNSQNRVFLPLIKGLL